MNKTFWGFLVSMFLVGIVLFAAAYSQRKEQAAGRTAKTSCPCGLTCHCHTTNRFVDNSTTNQVEQYGD